MRNQDRSLGYFFLLLLALAAGAVRLDAEVPDQAGTAPDGPRFDRSSLACSAADAASRAPFCASGASVAWADS
jgi:hypothetical protein